MDDFPTIVAFDCNALTCLTGPDCDDKTKLTHLFAHIDKKRGRAILPTPALAEYLVKADKAGLALIETLDNRASVKVGEFDIAAAYEASNMDAAAIGRGHKKDGSDNDWQKVKYDRQIVAIAKVHGAKLIVSNDNGVRWAAARVGMKGMGIDELPLPDHARQHKLPITDRPAAPSEE